MRTQENLVKKRRVLKDPAQKRLRKQQRRASREVRATTQHLTRVARRMNRAAKYNIRQMRAHVVERIHEQEKLAAQVVKKKAAQLGFKTSPEVHFKLDMPGDSKKPKMPESYVPIKYANKELVQDAKAAFSPGDANKAASASVEETLKEG